VARPRTAPGFGPASPRAAAVRTGITARGDLAWSNNTPDLAIFGAGSGAAGVVTLGSAITTAGLKFAAPGSGNYTIADGGYALTLNGNIVANQSANVSAPITLGQSAIFSVATGQTLTVSGVLAGSGGAGLTVLGPGTVALTGPNNLGLSNGMAGSVLVSSGTLSLHAGGSQYGTLGNAAGIVISAGATLALLDSNDLSGAGGLRQNITLNGGTLTDLGLNQAIGSLTLNGGAVTGGGSPAAGSFNLGGDCIANTNLTLAAQNITTASGTTFYVKASNTLTVTGAIIGPGGLNFAGPGNLVLSASNTYAGNTTVSSGSFLVYGALGTGSLTVGGGTFGGAAVIGGPATMLSGANFLISPGVIGGFACNAGLALSAGATTSLKISKSLSTNDQVLVVGTLAYGGTLSVSNLSGTLAAGDAFPVFHATSYTGSFAVITPAVPGAGLVWNTSTLAVDGALRVAAAGPASFGATGLQGADLVLSVTGGPPGSPYHLVTSADVSLPLTNWTPIWSNNFDGNGNGPAWSNTLDTTIPRQFYDVVVP
jgi:fibronectin-binding autotransporter adhesin